MPRKDMKEKILEAFTEIFKQDDFDKINVNCIVKKANISRQTFYNHFKDIYGILEYALERKIDNNFSLYNNGLTLEQYINRILNDLYSNRTFIIKLKESKYHNFVESILIKKSKDVVTKNILQFGSNYSNEEFEFYNEFFTAGFGTFAYRLCMEDDVDIDKIANNFARMYNKLFNIN